MSQLVQQTSPIVAELVGLFFITILITGLIVYTDIRFHDDYVKDLVSRCYPENQEDVCVEKRERFGLPDDAHIELGNPYWELLAIQFVVIPLGFSGFRLVTILVRKRKLTSMRVFIVILWGLLPLTLFYFGVIDVFYYLGRGMEIPDTLDWLNSVGIFNYTKAFGEDPVNVERSDLLFTFALGVTFVISLFFIAVKMYQQSRLRGMV